MRVTTFNLTLFTTWKHSCFLYQTFRWNSKRVKLSAHEVKYGKLFKWMFYTKMAQSDDGQKWFFLLSLYILCCCRSKINKQFGILDMLIMLQMCQNEIFRRAKQMVKERQDIKIVKIGQTVGRYRDFCDFPDGCCRHLEFSKIRNFNGLSAVGGQYASSRQISSKSVKRLQRYGDLTVFKMAAVRYLGFVRRRLGPPTATSWWSLSLCQIWLKSMK